jgi:hypothetical protein
MNRRSFFGTVGGGAVAAAFARVWPFSRRGQDVPDAPHTELWVQALLDDGSTLNWVIRDPQPNQTFPGPYIYQEGVIESITVTGYPSALDRWSVEITPVYVYPGDTIGLQLGDFKVTDV